MSERPASIGKYRILGVAGRGGMGVVYVAHDPFIDRKVAIKVCSVDQDQAHADVARKLFFNEAQAAGALDHPNILKVYDAGEADGKPYFVMEYVEHARTLRPHVEPDDLLPIPMVIKIMQQCANALDYAHRRGVLHRDIKPGNILLTEDDQAKIGDFGIAQRLHVEEDDTLAPAGSPIYMSPEQAQGEQLTQQTDLYSLGVSMYELLTGNPPFRARGLAQLALMISTREPTPIREYRPDVAPALERIVQRAMAKKLSERYRSGEELAADLAASQERLGREAIELGPEEKFAALRGLEFFAGFSDGDLTQVLEAAVWVRFGVGDRVITEGAVEQGFYVIVTGEVSVLVGGRRVGTLAAGDCVGEVSYLSDTKRTATVVSVEDVTAIKVEAPLVEWASIPVQMRFTKAFQQTLIDRLTRTTYELAKYVG